MARKSNRRELIIDTATSRFLVSGYDVVTVDELCGLTSSTKGSFYHFFENKEALAIDVVNHVWNLAETALEDNFSSDIGPRKQLSAEIERIASSYIRSEGKRYFIGCPIGTLAVSLRGKSLKLTRRLTFALTHMRQFYLDAFERGLDGGDIQSTLSAADLADQLLVGLQGMSTLGKAQPGSRKVREVAALLQKTLP
ncbi:MAG: TetR/AcrR family transcriptional regulator [Proteobacteria bacterium]|nr:TetR/AcrR family transcriptional regulator [Pseudomonadota bacterium]